MQAHGGWEKGSESSALLDASSSSFIADGTNHNDNVP